MIRWRSWKNLLLHVHYVGLVIWDGLQYILVFIDEGEVVQHRDALVGYFGLSPTFILGIWNGGEWLNGDFS